MIVNVEYVAQMRSVAGKGSEAVELPDQTSIGDLLAKLAVDNGESFGALLFEQPGRLRSSTLVFVGDDQIESDDVSRPLSDGQKVTILAPLAGG